MGVGVVRYLGPHSRPWLPPQRNFSLSVNSVAVLRLMGKGAGPPLTGTSRGRGSTRSRGRGVMACPGGRQIRAPDFEDVQQVSVCIWPLI